MNQFIIIHKSEPLSDQEIARFSQSSSLPLQKTNNLHLLILSDSSFDYLTPQDQVEIINDFNSPDLIYYTKTTDYLIVSNSLKSILKHKNTAIELDEEVIIEYLALDYYNLNKTLYKDINILAFDQNLKISTNSYSIENQKCIFQDKYSIKQDESFIKDSIKDLAVTNFNLLLSGGVDSTLILASLAKHYSISSLSVIYPQQSCNEKQVIDSTLQAIPHKNRQINYKPLCLAEVQQLVSDLLYFPDYPNSHAFIKLAQCVDNNILLSGIGGDQLFHRSVKSVQQKSILSYLKYFLLERCKLRKVTGKKLIPQLSISAEMNYLSKKFYADFEEDHLISSLYSANFQNYYRSFKYLAKNYNIKIFSPYLTKQSISFARTLSDSEAFNKTYAKLLLKDLINKPEWPGPLKPDFSYAYLQTLNSSDILDVYESATKDFSQYIDLGFAQTIPNQIAKGTTDSKVLGFAWAMVGLKLLKDYTS